MSILCVYIHARFWQEIYGLCLIVKIIHKKSLGYLENFECNNYQESAKR